MDLFCGTQEGKIRMSEWKLKLSTQYTEEFSKMNALCNSSHHSKDPHRDITESVLESMKIQYLNTMEDPNGGDFKHCGMFRGSS